MSNIVSQTSMDAPENRRLLFVAPSAYPLGGVQTWLDYLLPELARRGWEPLLGLVSGRWHDPHEYMRLHPGHEVVVIANPTGSREGRICALMNAIRRTHPAIVAGVNIPDCHVAVARLREKDMPHAAGFPKNVLTLHGIQPDLFEDAQRMREDLDAVVCTNRLAREVAVAHDIPRERVFYAPYGVPSDPRPPARVPSGRLRLAYVGRFDAWQKRVQDIALIFERLCGMGVDVELRIAGVGPGEQSLRRALAPYEAAGRVQFLGSVAPTAVATDVYPHADVLLLASLWETGPIVIWEAMASGLAIATSTYVGSGAEASLIDDENCVMFKVGDVDGAARQIARLTNPKLRERLCAAAFALIRSRYTRASSADAWSTCFEQITEAPALPPSRSPTPVAHAGRLDRWLGPSLGESVRRSFGIRFAHQTAGGEWPHSYGERGLDDSEFWRNARKLDRRA